MAPINPGNQSNFFINFETNAPETVALIGQQMQNLRTQIASGQNLGGIGGLGFDTGPLQAYGQQIERLGRQARDASAAVQRLQPLPGGGFVLPGAQIGSFRGDISGSSQAAIQQQLSQQFFRQLGIASTAVINEKAGGQLANFDTIFARFRDPRGFFAGTPLANVDSSQVSQAELSQVIAQQNALLRRFGLEVQPAGGRGVLPGFRPGDVNYLGDPEKFIEGGGRDALIQQIASSDEQRDAARRLGQNFGRGAVETIDRQYTLDPSTNEFFRGDSRTPLTGRQRTLAESALFDKRRREGVFPEVAPGILQTPDGTLIERQGALWRQLAAGSEQELSAQQRINALKTQTIRAEEQALALAQRQNLLNQGQGQRVGAFQILPDGTVVTATGPTRQTPGGAIARGTVVPDSGDLRQRFDQQYQEFSAELEADQLARRRRQEAADRIRSERLPAGPVPLGDGTVVNPKTGLAIDPAQQALFDRTRPENRSAVGQFFGGVTGAGMFSKENGINQNALLNLAGTAGNVAKYTLLYQGLFAIIGAAQSLLQEAKNLSDSLRDLRIAMQTTEDPSNAFIGNLNEIARIAGANVGEAMDAAVRGVRAFGDEVARLETDKVEQIARQVTEVSTQISLITGKTLTDSTADVIAAGTAFGYDPSALQSVSDAIVNAKNIVGGDPKQVSQGVANIAAVANEAGLSLKEAAAAIGLVNARLDISGSAISTRISRVLSILQGNTGAKVKNQLNQIFQVDEESALFLRVEDTARDSLQKIGFFYAQAEETEKQFILSRLGGRSNTRELIPILTNYEKIFGGFDQATQEFANVGTSVAQFKPGAGFDETLQKSDDLVGTLRRISGSVKQIQGELSRSNLFLPFGIAIKTLEPVLTTLGRTLNLVNQMTESFDKLAKSIPIVGDAMRKLGITADGALIFVAQAFLAVKAFQGLKGVLSGVAIPGFFRAKGTGATATAATAATSTAGAAFRGESVAGAAPLVFGRGSQAAQAAATEASKATRAMNALNRGVTSFLGAVGNLFKNTIVRVASVIAVLKGITDLATYKQQLSDLEKELVSIQAQGFGPESVETLEALAAKGKTTEERLSFFGKITEIFTNDFGVVNENLDAAVQRAKTTEELLKQLRIDANQLPGGETLGIWGTGVLTLEDFNQKMEQLAETGAGAATAIEQLDLFLGRLASDDPLSLGSPGELLGEQTKAVVDQFLLKDADGQDPLILRRTKEALERGLKSFDDVDEIGSNLADQATQNLTATAQEAKNRQDLINLGLPEDLLPEVKGDLGAADFRQYTGLPDQNVGELIAAALQGEATQGKLIKFVDDLLLPYAKNPDTFAAVDNEIARQLYDGLIRLGQEGFPAAFKGTEISEEALRPFVNELVNQILAPYRGDLSFIADAPIDQILAAIDSNQGFNDRLSGLTRNPFERQGFLDDQVAFIERAYNLMLSSGRVDTEIVEEKLQEARNAQTEGAAALLEQQGKVAVSLAEGPTAQKLIAQTYYDRIAQTYARNDDVDGLVELIESGNQAQLDNLKKWALNSMRVSKSLAEGVYYNEIITNIALAEELAVAGDDAFLIPGADDADSGLSLAQAKRLADAARKGGEIAPAKARLLNAKEDLRDADKGSVEYYEALAEVYEAQREYAEAIADYQSTARRLAFDITDPLLNAREDVKAARAAVRRLKKAGAGRDAIAQAELELRESENALEQTKFDEEMKNIDTKRELGRISEAQYYNYLLGEKERLESIKQRTYQQQEQLDEVDKALKDFRDQNNNQWNLGDIDLPTPYEMRRFMASQGEYYAGQERSTVDVTLRTNDSVIVDAINVTQGAVQVNTTTVRNRKG
jgi:hypothetical protein